ncbi:MAG TPA: cytochrome d ubiquinol oxidase subunit II [Gemmatimonadaceae bacterium]|jgi:cytochrome d ubiquinol oxidase subunit II|nr:cytochrome d ubiquinol oxidase subunit II [Gemmatimonadaceae bacterium]
MDLPLLSALFLLFALAMYVMLDGFDLGVGALLLGQRDQRVRNRMVDAIAPTWDGNETWLVMAALTLLAGFPRAYGILLPAFYVPIILMLLALGLRGVSFEFRHNSEASRRRWDAVFAGGSLIAALAQGLIVGGLMQGVDTDLSSFGGSPLDTLRPFCLLTGLTVVTGYATLGLGWLRLKGEEATRAFARRHQRWLPLAFAALVAVTAAIAVTTQPRLALSWRSHPVALSICLFAFLGCAVGIVRSAGRDDADDRRGFGMALGLVLSAVVAYDLGFFPYVVPFRITLWHAASGRSTHAFLLIGALVATPVILGYTAFAYRVFRGRTPAEGWY